MDHSPFVPFPLSSSVLFFLSSTKIYDFHLAVFSRSLAYSRDVADSSLYSQIIPRGVSRQSLPPGISYSHEELARLLRGLA